MIPRNTDYHDDALIGRGTNVDPIPEDRDPALAYLAAHGAMDVAECLGLGA